MQLNIQGHVDVFCTYLEIMECDWQVCTDATMVNMAYTMDTSVYAVGYM